MTARIILITGKGGVGKTTVAAATAARCAQAGARTIVLSTDPAHSLADAYACELGDGVRAINPMLSGQQLDARVRLESAWSDVQEYLVELLDFAGASGIEAQELSVLPGLDEVFALADIRTHAQSGTWDVVVVDCAPTAETLRLLSLPDVLAWYMDKVFGPQRDATRVLRPFLRRATELPIAGDDVFAAVRRFYDRLGGVRELLGDASITSARIVVTPERMVIAEARRIATYLALFGYHVDAVVVNRVLPADVQDPWFDRWKVAQAEHLATINASFAPTPILEAPLEAGELAGIADLERFGAALYGAADPACVLHRGEGLRVQEVGGHFVMSIALPFASREEVDIGARDGELVVSVGPHRRLITLPDSLARREVVAARLRGAVLEVEFDGAAAPVLAAGR